MTKEASQPALTQAIIRAIEGEFRNPEFGSTRQFLDQGLKPERRNRRIHVANMTLDDTTVRAYVPVAGKSFYIEIVLSILDKPLLMEVHEIPGVIIRYSPFSKDLSTDELCALTCIRPDHTESAGKTYRRGKSDINSLTFEDVDPLPYHVKLNRFVQRLYRDHKNIRKLGATTGSQDIWIIVSFNSQFPLTTLDLDQRLLRKLAKMNLSVVWDIYPQ